MTTLELLQLNPLVMTKNIQLADKLLFHMKVINMCYLLFLMHYIIFEQILFCKYMIFCL